MFVPNLVSAIDEDLYIIEMYLATSGVLIGVPQSFEFVPQSLKFAPESLKLLPEYIHIYSGTQLQLVFI